MLFLLLLQQAFQGGVVSNIIISILQMRIYCINNIGQISKFKNCICHTVKSFTPPAFK